MGVRGGSTGGIYFMRHLADPTTVSLVAERTESIIGFITFHIRERLNRSEPEAWVPNFIVTAAEHGSGVVQELFGRACALAQEQGCSRVVLESNYSLHRAHRFYAKVGMVDAGKYLTLCLTP